MHEGSRSHERFHRMLARCSRASSRCNPLLIVVLVNYNLIDTLRFVGLPGIRVRPSLLGTPRVGFGFFRSRAALQLEILALRHQLGVLQGSVRRPKLSTADLLLWAWLCEVWKNWRSFQHRLCEQHTGERCQESVTGRSHTISIRINWRHARCH
jgi:hypothetical protein